MNERPFAFMRRRRPQRSRIAGAVAIVVILIGGGVAGWFWLRSPDEAQPSIEAVAPPPGTTAPSPGLPEEIPPLELPALSASDQFVRGLVSRLSAHPQLARWLVTDDLVYRFVGAVVSLAGGVSPSAHVDFLIPDESFPTVSGTGGLTLDPRGYTRFALLVETFVSLDTDGTARLYHQLHPLFEEAFQELGIPGTTFDDVMARAVQNVRSARIPEGPLELVLVEDVYEYRNPSIEGLSELEKHFIRMGPDHSDRIQAKVGELAARIGVAAR